MGKKAKAIAEIASGSWGALHGSLGLLSSGLTRNPAGALLNAAILAPSIYGIVKGSKRLKGSGIGKHMSISDAKKYLKKHPHDKKIYLHDLVKLTKAKKTKILNTIDRYLNPSKSQSGSGLIKSLSNKARRGLHHVRKFIDGETAYKPSDLLGHISSATGVASVFVPQLAIPSLAAGIASKGLKSVGKGLKLAGEGLYLPGSGKKSCNCHKGEGLKLAGEGKKKKSNKSTQSIKIKSKSKSIPRIGSKRQVWNGNAKQTSGGLTKENLMKNKRGKVVSKKQHAAGLKNLKFLKK